MAKIPVRITLISQIAFITPVAAIAYWLDPVKGYSCLLGALIYLVPNLYFTLYAFRFSKVEHVQWIAKSFNTGEYGKLALVAVGFALVLKFIQPLNPVMLFAGFCSLVALQWFIALKIVDALAEVDEKK